MNQEETMSSAPPPQIVGIIGSPRKGMNTDILVQSILDGCRQAGAAVSTIYLDDLAIRPCRACKVQDGVGCVIDDDMAQLYAVFEAADGLVLGTPVYYNSVSGQMKLMIDRSYCLAQPVLLPDGRRSYRTTVAKHKRGVVVAVGGSGTNPDCVLPVFEIWAPEVNLEIVDTLLATQARLGIAPRESAALMRDAFALGESFARSLRSGNIPR